MLNRDLSRLIINKAKKMEKNNLKILIIVVISMLFSTVFLTLINNIFSSNQFWEEDPMYSRKIKGLSIANGDSNNGIAICNANGDQHVPQICSDGMGGVFIAWIDLRNETSYYDIYAQRIDSNGNVQWISNGIAVCSVNGSQYDPEICSDGEGGAIITWIDGRSEETGENIYSHNGGNRIPIGNKKIFHVGKR